MILLIAGVKEGVTLAERLKAKGLPVMVAARTPTCLQAAQAAGLPMAALDSPDALAAQFTDPQVTLVVDASTENRTEVQALMQRFSSKATYLRYYREEIQLPEMGLVSTVYAFEEAAELAAKQAAKTLFMTTGSHNLDLFLHHPQLAGKRLVVRVLPDWKVIKKCQELGVAPKNLVALQGPFSKRINKALFRMYGAELVITRDSGVAGGADTKLMAALELGIPIIVIKRKLTKDIPAAVGLEEAVAIITKIQGGNHYDKKSLE